MLLSECEYDQTFDEKVYIGHTDLISWFSNFALHSLEQDVLTKRLFDYQSEPNV